MEIVILGGAGELGSHFAKLCLDRGDNVTIIDVVRFYEAWRLVELDVADKVEYIWKSSLDITSKDFETCDIILDCACQADRPLGTSSPRHTMQANLGGPLAILESVKRLDIQPLIIYPSSCVEFLGVPQEDQPITEETIPKPTNMYGWSKWVAEEMYLTHSRAFDSPCTIVRTGSCYAPMMRTDQAIAQFIIKSLKNENLYVKSPDATRTYTYAKDVLDFYELFLKKFESDTYPFRNLVISNGGNAEDRPFTTIEAARIIADLVGYDNFIEPASYESGEYINGKPVYQWEAPSKIAKSLLGWEPKYTFEDGLKETIQWFKTKY